MRIALPVADDFVPA